MGELGTHWFHLLCSVAFILRSPWSNRNLSIGEETRGRREKGHLGPGSPTSKEAGKQPPKQEIQGAVRAWGKRGVRPDVAREGGNTAVQYGPWGGGGHRGICKSE